MDIQLTNGDFVKSLYGDIAVVSDDDILQTAINNIMTIYGEMEQHPELGNTAFVTRMKLSEMNMKTISDACSVAVLQDSRINKVTSMIAVKSTKIYGQCDINFTLITNDGKLLSSATSINVI